MYERKIDVASESYNTRTSHIPELIGKHPGIIAPVIIWKPNPLQLVKPASASRVSGMMEVELCIRQGNEDLEKNLKKIVLTIDGKRFEFDKPPCVVQFRYIPCLPPFNKNSRRGNRHQRRPGRCCAGVILYQCDC